ncbi:MAG: hypothetical protein ACE5HJ_09610 [Thermoplasmata archaeon]
MGKLREHPVLIIIVLVALVNLVAMIVLIETDRFSGPAATAVGVTWILLSISLIAWNWAYGAEHDYLKEMLKRRDSEYQSLRRRYEELRAKAERQTSLGRQSEVKEQEP